MALLFYTGEFSVALVDDHVEQGVAHLLRWDLAQVLPFALAFEMSELDFFGFDSAEEGVELEAGDFVAVDADFFPPFVEETNPVAEGSDFCYFAGHNVKTI